MRSAGLVLIVLLASGSARADQLTVVNGTDSAVVSLFVSERGADWGPDQLDEPLAPGASITAQDVAPGSHRVRLIDEDDNECVVDGIAVQGATTWTITDDALDGCEPEEATPGKGAALAPGTAASKVSAVRTRQDRRFSVE